MFCRQCGNPSVFMIPKGDQRVRDVCSVCAHIHYENPKMVVGTLPLWQENGQDFVLLCRRAIEPRRGFWTLPAGFMENGETTCEGALRETQEEAGAQAKLGQLLTVIEAKKSQQVHFFYLAQLLSPLFTPCPDETLEVKLFRQDEIPWNDISFPTVETTLRYFFSQRRWFEVSLIPTAHLLPQPQGVGSNEKSEK